MADKETKEVLVGVLKLATMLVGEFKDGVQASDAMEIYAKVTSEPLKSALLDLYNGIDQVPSELKSLSYADAFDLAIAALPELAVLVSAIKK